MTSGPPQREAGPRGALMDDVMATQFLWAVVIVGGIVGIVVLTKIPELLVALLMVGARYIQYTLQVLGFEVSRRTFATAGAVIFIPVVLLFLVMRMVQTREREPIIGRPNTPFLVATIMMGLWLLIGLTYTVAPRYGAQKAGEYFIFGMAPMLLVFVFLRDRSSVHRLLLWVILVTGGTVLIASAHALATRGTLFVALRQTQEEVIGGISVAGHVGLSTPLVTAMAASLGLSAGRARGRWKVLPIVILPVVALYVTLSGTRSNLVVFVFVVVVGFYYTYKKNKGILAVAVVVLLVTGTLLLLYSPPEVKERMFSSWIERETRAGRGGYGRLEIIGAFPSQFRLAPVFGQGTGGWAVLYTGFDAYVYPHNMFIEILVENGLVGFVVLMFLWYLVLRRIWRHLRTAAAGTDLFGMAVFGVGLLGFEFFNGLAHFGLAHHSCTLLLSFAVILRSTFLAEAPETHGEEVVEGGALVRPVLDARVAHGGG